jgi:hypothetical protein
MRSGLVILVLLSLSRFSHYVMVMVTHLVLPWLCSFLDVSVFCVFIVLFKKASFSKSSADMLKRRRSRSLRKQAMKAQREDYQLSSTHYPRRQMGVGRQSQAPAALTGILCVHFILIFP